jgi:hypothetical protein
MKNTLVLNRPAHYHKIIQMSRMMMAMIYCTALEYAPHRSNFEMPAFSPPVLILFIRVTSLELLFPSFIFLTTQNYFSFESIVMSFRIFSGSDPHYEVVNELVADWSVGKFFKVKRVCDDKVRLHEEYVDFLRKTR